MRILNKIKDVFIGTTWRTAHYLKTDKKIVYFFGKDGKERAIEFRANHPEFKRRHIKMVILTEPELFNDGEVYYL